MMYDYNIFQGNEAYISCKTLSSTFVMSNGIDKYTSNEIVNDDEGLKIHLASSMTSGFLPGPYDYQIVSSSGLEMQGKLRVEANLLYTDDISSYWKRLLNAIDDILMGRVAAGGTSSVHVGDKSLSYYSLEQLMTLREYVNQRIAEEEDTFSPNNEKKIFYDFDMSGRFPRPSRRLR